MWERDAGWTMDDKLQAERNARHIAAGRPVIDPVLINVGVRD